LKASKIHYQYAVSFIKCLIFVEYFLFFLRRERVFLTDQQKEFYSRDQQAAIDLFYKIQFFKKMNLIPDNTSPTIDIINNAHIELNRMANCQVVIKEKVANKPTIWICPVCNVPNDDTAMIACDSCDVWFHFECVDILKAPAKKKQWFCGKCIGKQQKDLSAKAIRSATDKKKVSPIVIKYLTRKPVKRSFYQALYNFAK